MAVAVSLPAGTVDTRPCRLAPGALDKIDRWLAMLRQALERNYDRLDAVLAELEQEDGKETS